MGGGLGVGLKTTRPAARKKLALGRPERFFSLGGLWESGR